MTPNNLQLGLPRRLLASYLFFSLLALICLTAGGIYATHAFVADRTTDNALSTVGRLASAIELDYVKHHGNHAQQIVEKASANSGCVYLAIISPTGTVLAHNNVAIVGSDAPVHAGEQLSWGGISGIRYQDPGGRLIDEYQVRLTASQEEVGILVLGIREHTWSETILNLGAYGLLVILGPIFLIAIGGMIIARMVRPVSAVDEQLTQIARVSHTNSVAIEKMRPNGLAAVGWNRLAERLENLVEIAAHSASREESDLITATSSPKLEALDSLSEGIVVTDAEGRVEFINHAVSALTGIDDPLDNAHWESALSTLSPKIGDALEANSSRTHYVEDFAVDSCGREVALRVSRVPLKSAERQGHVWTLRDVTQQKKANESRDQFIDTATHELRTPLANIKAYAETLASCELGDAEQQKEFCNTINTEATRLARFVDDLLSISSLEVGSLGVKRTNTDVERLAEEAADKVKPLMVSKSLVFDVQLSKKLGEASWDKDKISGLLVNLLGNAAKYTKEGGQVAFTVLRDESHVRFEVSDSGAGIAEEEQDKVFEKFFRSSNPDVQESVGTGLGLPLAREIARLHDGDITLESTLGEGSVFTVVLPT